MSIAQRGERRLRSWWRHGRDVGSAQHEAPRGQKKTTEEEAGLESHSGLRTLTPLPPGTRLEPLEETLHWFIPGLEALCPDDCVVPSLSMPVLADRAADGVDASCLTFLVSRAVEDKKKDEEEEREQEEVKRLEEAVVTRMQRLEAEVMKYTGRDRLSDLENAAVTLVVHSNVLKKRRERRRKRKKRSKKKLPKAPLPPCALQRQVPAVESALRFSSSTTCGHSCCAAETVAVHRKSSTSLSCRRGSSGGRCPCCAGRACHAAHVSTTAVCAQGW